MTIGCRAQLFEIIVVTERQILVELFGRQHFGRGSFRLATVFGLDSHACENLRTGGECPHAEAERQPQYDAALEQLNVQYPEVAGATESLSCRSCRFQASASRRPRR
jgi:hypothetical protein